MDCGADDERWIWLSIAPKHRLILSAHVGDMTQKAANEVVKETCERINENNLPTFVTDGRSFYKQALLDRYSYFEEFPRTGKRGRPRKPKQVPLKKLKYAQLVKEQKGGKLNTIKKRVIFGNIESIDDSMICTSLIERQNLNLRQKNKRLARKTIAYSKEDEWLQYHVTLQMAAHNFTRPHMGLKKENPKQINGKTWKKYDKITPMMSIGLTEHIWSIEELLTFPYHKNISI
jgi:IS1 family transposase